MIERRELIFRPKDGISDLAQMVDAVVDAEAEGWTIEDWSAGMGSCTVVLARDPISDDFTATGRGFKCSEPIVGQYNQEISIFESSTAFTTAIWVRVADRADLNNMDGPNDVEAMCLLKHEDAIRLRDQLTWLLDNHHHIVAYGKAVDEEDD